MKKSIICLAWITFLTCISTLFFFNPVSASDSRIMELKFATDIPPMDPLTKNWQKWGQEIEKRTDGKVKITFYFGGSLIKGEEIRRGLVRGMIDIAIFTIDHDPAAYRLNSVMQLPLMGFPSQEAATRIWVDIIEKFSDIAAEYKGTKRLWHNIPMRNYIHTTKQPVRTPEDLKGLKISGLGATIKYVDALGANAVSLMPMDVYLGLERGISEGVVFPWAAVLAFRTIKLVSYHNEIPISNICMQCIMSGKTWERLSPESRKIFNDLSPGARDADMATMLVMERKIIKIAKDMGHTFIKVNDVEEAAWHKKVTGLHDKWIAENEARGMPAGKIYQEVKQLIKKYDE